MTADLRELPTASVQPNPDQPRKSFEREPLEELADSIRSLGVLEPILVRPVPSTAGAPGHWQIIAGERRWRAATMAGLERIPVVICEDLDDRAAFLLSMVENVLRRDMNPVEEAHGYRSLIGAGMTIEEIAAQTGKRASAIRSALTLLDLEPGIRDLVAKRHLTAWDGTRLATLSWNGQARALATIQAGGLTGNDRDRVIGQIWRAEHEVAMFSDAEAPVSEPARRELREELERAAKALTAAERGLDGTMPDALTTELAEAVLRAAGRIAKVTRQAKVARMLEETA